MESSFFYNLPKVEIHNHLEGTINSFVTHELAKKNVSESVFAESKEECNKLFSFTDFNGFLKSFAKINSFIKNVDDLDIIFKNSANSLANENYRYVEYFLSIDTFLKKNISLPDILDRIKSNCKKHSTDKFVIGGIIIDFVRNYGPDSATKILADLKPILDDYRDIVLGVSIGGDEVNFPAPAFKEVFELARKLHLKTTAHAGESAGSDSIWDTIFNLKTDRIGHGLHAYESNDLIKHLRVTQTPLEICPTSNIKTGLIADIKNHPLQKYVVNGLKITINTDDSGFFTNQLSSEIEKCANAFNFDEFDIKQFTLNAAHSSFYDEFSKKELIENLKIDLERYSL